MPKQHKTINGQNQKTRRSLKMSSDTNAATASNPESSIPFAVVQGSVGPPCPSGKGLVLLPVEVLREIFSYLPSSSHRELAVTHRETSPPANALLYQKPRFASTYRLAQFTTTITSSRVHANFVRDIEITNDVTQKGYGPSRRAGWREWKYRSTLLYSGNISRNRLSNHPLANKRLPDAGNSGTPIGTIIHILKACRNLR